MLVSTIYEKLSPHEILCFLPPSASSIISHTHLWHDWLPRHPPVSEGLWVGLSKRWIYPIRLDPPSSDHDVAVISGTAVLPSPSIVLLPLRIPTINNGVIITTLLKTVATNKCGSVNQAKSHIAMLLVAIHISIYCWLNDNWLIIFLRSKITDLGG